MIVGNDSPDVLAVRVDALEKQVTELFDRLNDREIGPSVLAAKLNQVLVTIGEVKQAVESLKGRPSRLWDNLITGGTGAVIGAIVAAAAAHFH